MHLEKLMGHSDITATREFYLCVGDANEREATNLRTKLLDTPSSAESPTKNDARVTPGEVGGEADDNTAGGSASFPMTYKFGARGFEPPTS